MLLHVTDYLTSLRFDSFYFVHGARMGPIFIQHKIVLYGVKSKL